MYRQEVKLFNREIPIVMLANKSDFPRDPKFYSRKAIKWCISHSIHYIETR